MTGIAVGIDVDIAFLEGLEQRRILQEILDGDLVVIVGADLGGNVLAPIVRIALIGDALAGLHRLHLVGTGPDRRRQRRTVEGFWVDRMFRQHREQAEDQRRFAVGLVVEGETHAVLADLLHFGDDVEAVGEGHAALVAHQLEGEHHVLGRHRLAIGPFRLRIEVELDEAPVVIPFDRLGKQAVEREGLVLERCISDS